MGKVREYTLINCYQTAIKVLAIGIHFRAIMDVAIKLSRKGTTMLQQLDKTLYDGFYFGGNDWNVVPMGLSLMITCDGNDTGLRVIRYDGQYSVRNYEGFFNTMHEILVAVSHNPFYYGLNSL